MLGKKFNDECFELFRRYLWWWRCLRIHDWFRPAICIFYRLVCFGRQLHSQVWVSNQGHSVRVRDRWTFDNRPTFDIIVCWYGDQWPHFGRWGSYCHSPSHSSKLPVHVKGFRCQIEASVSQRCLLWQRRGNHFAHRRRSQARTLFRTVLRDYH